ncbi:MAG: DUF72 domain-containing protein [Candidatus Dormibacteria bacterium]
MQATLPETCEHGPVEARILVGTCNWSDHQGFYPEGQRPSARLAIAVSDRRLVTLRFPGRNRDALDARGAASADRFNYRYRDQELRGWEPQIRRLGGEAAKINLPFNNDRSNYAVGNGLQMAEILDLGRPSPRLALAPPAGHPAGQPQLPVGPTS